MRIRAFVPSDLASLTELTIETFRPFYEEAFRPLMGEVVFAIQHGNWRDDYRQQVAGLYAPEHHAYVAVAEGEDGIAGYVAWSVDPDRRHGRVVILAVSSQHRRRHVGTTLCEHAFEQMRLLGAEIVEIGTGGDSFHAPARALYEQLGCTPIPVAVYFRQL
ncbi:MULTISPECIES: GNAT family N-acetyltransferase [Streptomyces]|uniref:N-acetyltransferase n=1 Tax=Streptomyces dengpaensis TaxID=2049881 RepID=A0ABN5I767_9ACTN|nr:MULTISPECIES: GNAT family N-acetyltransferase [Streptomyces]AVH58962.1 N-acetyltransferase [Streptomyces dengpaensis]PIB10990.1 GNAT family N-acetyltransferase [Streptomyces sp. HG99]